MKIHVWRYDRGDLDVASEIHVINGDGFAIQGGALVINVDGEPTLVVRTWDYAEIKRSENTEVPA